MISKREQNKRDTNDRLLSAARILFSAQGFASTTVDDIAERAEVSRATFFNYFQGKDSVLEALHSDHLDQLAALVDQLMESPMPTSDRISRIFQDFAQQAIMHPRYLRMVTAELERDFASSGAGGGPRSSVPRGTSPDRHCRYRSRRSEIGLPAALSRTDDRWYVRSVGPLLAARRRLRRGRRIRSRSQVRRGRHRCSLIREWALPEAASAGRSPKDSLRQSDRRTDGAAGSAGTGRRRLRTSPPR